MNRWAAVLLLLLVPFTLAPRTSLDGSVLSFDIVAPEGRVRTGAAITLVVSVKNVSGDDYADAGALLGVTFTGEQTGPLLIVAKSANCQTPRDQSSVAANTTMQLSCAFGAFDAGEVGQVRLVLRPTTAGTLTLDVNGYVTLAGDTERSHVAGEQRRLDVVDTARGSRR